MGNISMREMLEAIPDSYDDFVEGMLHIVASNKETEDAVRTFISEKKNVTTSDVIEYVDDELMA